MLAESGLAGGVRKNRAVLVIENIWKPIFKPPMNTDKKGSI
jgi:hypothetical protein